MEAGGQHQRHHVPAPHAAGAEVPGQHVGHAQPLRESDSLVAVDVGLAVAERGHGGIHDLPDRRELAGQG
jgi:hypothetical protein